MRIVLAGGTGVVGRALVPLLVAGGHDVTVLSRRPGTRLDGATVVGCDVLDRDTVRRVLTDAAPDAVIDQLTDLPARYGDLRRGTATTDRLRTEGTGNLVEAAGTARVITQSLAFAYTPAPGPAGPDAPLWTDAPQPFATSVAAVVEHERIVRDRGGVVLRYGALYGTGTWFAPDGDVTAQVRARRFPIVGSGAGLISWTHPADAASAAVHALTAEPGTYDIVDDDPVSYAEFLPWFADLLGAKRPRRVPAMIGRLAAGRFAVEVTTRQRAASNAAARAWGWAPGYPDWRAGFAESFSA